MEKINIAELLKDCPKGMELDCLLFKDAPVYFNRITNSFCYPIEIKVEHPDGSFETFELSKEGCIYDRVIAKCVIFPKGKTTWEGFHRPFVDGDVVTCKYENGLVSMILNKFVNFVEVHYYCVLYNNAKGFITNNYIVGEPKYTRFATEEEKAKLFQAIKDNGYKWNEETKTLSKLVQPNFEVGNKIEKCGYSFIIAEVKDDYYLTKCGNKIPIDYQDDFSLVPNKFDITNLKPFDKVLVRVINGRWRIQFFERINKKNKNYPFVCINGSNYKQCIPYEGNEHLLGTIDDCDEYYKTW